MLLVVRWSDDSAPSDTVTVYSLMAFQEFPQVIFFNVLVFIITDFYVGGKKAHHHVTE